MAEMLGQTYDFDSAGQDDSQRLELCQKLAAQSAVPPYMSRVLRAVAADMDEDLLKSAGAKEGGSEASAATAGSEASAVTQPISKRQARRLLQKQIEDGYVAKFGKPPDGPAMRKSHQSRPVDSQ